MSVSGTSRILFLYWGRRGAMTPFAYQAALTDLDDVETLFSISRQNERFEQFRLLGERLLPVDTFRRGYGALTELWRVPGLRAMLTRRIRRDRIDAVVNLMPHVWTPLVAGAVKRAGARFVTIVHDAERHPGDRTGLVLDWQLREMAHADAVVTLSRAVAERLGERYPMAAGRIETLFHPDFAHEDGTGPHQSPRGGPFRLLFFGRVMHYKGLGLLVETLERLKARGLDVRLGFFGEGDISQYRSRLEALDAEIVNRWLGEDEIAPIFARHDALVLSHTSASQSGVAALAAGGGLPIVATPVGGLVEQLADGRIGLLAREVSSEALADAIGRLVTEPDLYRSIVASAAADRDARSMRRFMQALSGIALGRPG